MAVVTANLAVELVSELDRVSTWAVAAGAPFGGFVGALLAAFLWRRGRVAPTFERLLFEVIALGAVSGAVVSQVVLPVAWNLPRLKITAIVTLCAAVFAGAAALLLKGLYWRPVESKSAKAG